MVTSNRVAKGSGVCGSGVKTRIVGPAHRKLPRMAGRTLKNGAVMAIDLGKRVLFSHSIRERDTSAPKVTRARVLFRLRIQPVDATATSAQSCRRTSPAYDALTPEEWTEAFLDVVAEELSRVR